MKFQKKVILCFSLITAAVILSGCSQSKCPVSSGDSERISENSEMFSVLTVNRESGEMLADGKNAGQSCGGFTLRDDGTVTVNIDGNEVPFEEAEKIIGCSMTENSDGCICVSSPFQTSGVIVKSSGEFDTYGALAAEESIKDHWLLTYSSPAEAYSAYLKLSDDDNVEYAEPDAVMVSSGYSEEGRIMSWGTEATGAAEFCTLLNKNAEELPEVDVAVIDSGIYYDHSVFKDRILDGGRNYVIYSEKKAEFTGNFNAEDDNGHGSHCAGIICSSTGDNVKILPVKVLNDAGSGSTYGIYCGIMYAIERNVDIISISIGGYGKSYLYDEAIDEAVRNDITVCVAAGNESRGNSDYHSSLSDNEKCVVVSSVDETLSPSDFSNYQNIDFAAPGNDILSVSTEGPEEVTSMSGTSMATPFAAACFANILSSDSSLTSEEAYEILKENASDLCEPGYDDKTGWGLINLKGILTSGESEGKEKTEDNSGISGSDAPVAQEAQDEISDNSVENSSAPASGSGSYDSSLYAELNTPFINTSGEAYFVPEKSGKYSIILIPDRDTISEAVNNNGYMNYSLIESSVYNVTDGYSFVRMDAEYLQAGQITVTLEKGKLYKLKLSAKKSELLITDKPTLAECSTGGMLSYEYTGTEIHPEPELYFNGNILTEGRDYTVTAWNNTEPGIMYALLEGCGDYAGFMTAAMTVDGAGVTASRYRGNTVMDISPDKTFYMTDFLTYRITFEEDTLVTFRPGDTNTQMTSSLKGKYESDSLSISEGRTEYVKKGTYLVTFEKKSANSKLNYFTAVPNAFFETGPVNNLITDTSISVKTGKEVKPEFTVEYNGSVLEKGTDYSVSFTNTDAAGLYEASFRGKNDYSGRTVLQYYILPDAEYTLSEVSDGVNSISVTENCCFEWTPENDHYYVSSTSYNTADIVILDEEGTQVLCRKINGKTDADVKVEPGRKYFIYFFSRYSFDTELILKTEGRLSDCTAEYEKITVFSENNPDTVFIIKDGDRVLTEGTDYITVSDGFVNEPGRREYVFKGCGDYFGELILPVVSYRKNITDTENFTEPDLNSVCSFSDPLVPGESVNLKITNTSDDKTAYTFNTESEYPDCADYLTVFMYDTDGKFKCCGDDAKYFVLGKNETVYISVMLPYYYNTDVCEAAAKSVFYYTSEPYRNSAADKMPGDADCSGKINIFDVLRLKKYIVSGDELSEQGKINADLNGDNIVSAADLLYIKQLILN